MPCNRRSSNTSDNVNKTIETIQVNSNSEPSDCSSNDEENLYQKNLQGCLHFDDSKTQLPERN